MPANDLITFGDLCVDLLVSGGDVVPQFGQVEKLVGDYTLEMGGSCSIFACQAAKLGLRVGILGRVGTDRFGELILERLKESGVDCTHVVVDPDLKTGLTIALCKANDRAILTYMGGIDALTPADVSDDFLASARHLHHGSYFLQSGLRPGIPAIFARARQLGLSTSLDTNWDPAETWGEELGSLLPLVDVFMPNEPEALRIAHSSTVDVALDRLNAFGAGLIAVKQGADGALVSDGRRVLRQAVKPVSGGDSVGAGDSFDAGFLAGWLRGYSLEESLRIACACGHSVASQVGGLRGQPFWADVFNNQ